ncbi:MAG TPA: GNAT family N-acetyltransferase [Thermoleophilaceae bacterium]|nr:GNAT family N-acetyltransferase [Thermoleophilaceae bacterium]
MEIRELGIEEIELARPLWEALLEHHGRVAPPHAVPIRGPEDSWRRRRSLYEEWLAHPEAFALLAESGGAPVGYILVRMEHGDDTWSTGELTAHIETLSVSPEWRGRGVGTRLMDAVDDRLAAIGIRDLTVGAVATNDGAVRFYERRGLVRSIVIFRERREGV